MNNIMIRFIILIIFVFGLNNVFAQNVGVGTNNPDNSAELDVSANNKGVLIPRVNIANLSTAAPVASPATSLLVYNTNTTTGVGFYMWDGSKWTKLIDENTSVEDIDWREQGTGDIPDNINNNIYTGGNVSIGNVVATERLHVNGTTFQHGLKVDVNGNTIMGILPNDGQGNYNRYWNTTGGTSPTRISTGIAWQEYMNSTTSNNDNSNYRIRYGGYGAAGSAITWNDAFTVKYNNGFVGIKNNAPAYTLDVEGSITARAANSFRLRRDDYSVIHRNDNSNYYVWLTANGSPDGSWNTHRPLTIGLSTGDVTLGKSNTLFVDQSANRVGIGTGAPASKLHVNGNVQWGTAGAMLATNQGAAIELRGTGTPFIDFSNDASTNYDARLILANDNRLTFQGAEVNVIGVLSALRMKVTANGYPDYVFYDDYDLKTLEEVEEHIDEKGHLPGVPSEKEIVENGLDLNDQSMWQMEKIEELFLHTIELNKQVKELIETNKALLESNEALENRIKQLEEK